MLEKKYQKFSNKIDSLHKMLQRSLTYTEKIIYSHLDKKQKLNNFVRGQDYLMLAPDRLAMQDATGQMALLQFMNTGRKKVALPASIHCDHLITANQGAQVDLEDAQNENKAVYDFLKSAAKKYNIDYWKPGSGIIHQIILENYALPALLQTGTDSHTPNSGGLGMLGIGVGGADAVDVMAGLPWELKMPEILGIKLIGELPALSSAKDIILHIAGILKAKGATNAMLEYFGTGAHSLTASEKATVCNMGAEVGATSSIFPFDQNMYTYLNKTGRAQAANIALKYSGLLNADQKIYDKPEEYFNRVIEIDLAEIEPHINGPFTTDKAYSAPDFCYIPKETKAPAKISAGLIGSCTNSSYQDLRKVACILVTAGKHGLELKSELLINPGSAAVRNLCEEEGLLDIMREAGAKIMATACGPCIGMWKRDKQHSQKNTILTSFNRNFRKRNDGNPGTYAFLASPETVTIMALAGRIDFNPLQDFLTNHRGIKLSPARLLKNVELNMPQLQNPDQIVDRSFDPETKIKISKKSMRVSRLKSFPAGNAHGLQDLRLLIKTTGKCTTDHISPAGKWLKYRGNLDKISNNLLMGAENYFHDKPGYTKNPITEKYEKVSVVARHFKNRGLSSFIVAEDNYGEGSSREHAAMEPRHLGVRVVIAKSFARIHETNLKKQGVLALTFKNSKDYDIMKEDDRMDIIRLNDFARDKNLQALIKHADGEAEYIELGHTYSPLQIKWFKAGSSINWISKNKSNVYAK